MGVGEEIRKKENGKWGRRGVRGLQVNKTLMCVEVQFFFVMEEILLFWRRVLLIESMEII
jgi:hypothetical protein